MKRIIMQVKQSEHPFHPSSLLFLLVSDMFVLWLLFFGLSAQIQQLTPVHSYFPYDYRNILIEKGWNKDTIIDKLTRSIISDTCVPDPEEQAVLHPDIQTVKTMIAAMRRDTVLHTAFERYYKLIEEYEELTIHTRESEHGYTLQNRIAREKAALEQNPAVAAFCTLIFDYQTRNYHADIKQFQKRFALKRILIDTVFLIPLMILLILWHKAAIRKKWAICTEVSIHYVFLSFIPLLFEALRLTIEVFPEELLKDLYHYLQQMKLVSLWYYAVLFLFIILVIGIIRLFQTKLFTKQRSSIGYYAAGKCPQCGIKIHQTAHFCPVCGYAISVVCTSCGEDTPNNLPFCMHCGTKQRVHTES